MIDAPNNQYFYHFSYFASGEGRTLKMGVIYSKNKETAFKKVKKLIKMGDDYFDEGIEILKTDEENRSKIKAKLEVLFNSNMIDFFMKPSCYGGYLFNGVGEFHFESYVNFA